MFQVHFRKAPVHDVRDALSVDRRAATEFAHRMIDAGVYLLPNHPGFLSTTHGEGELARVRAAADAAFAEI
jgi:glutamate-1-semialdehyde aminotransferase